MIKSQDQDEFIAVRVQDPRLQNEGSWNSYVDFKIFLHTNSKAFTAKTSCVRRRYSEFVWLRKKLQKNAGLVPVPELPSKSFFISFNNEDFIEKRRKGLQSFLDKVVHTTVCLSDSQLHLFLQTQLPVSHIQDCVQGLTPYTVTDAILTYASSNQGWVQEEDSDSQEQCPTPVPYESMESPSPHMPTTQSGALLALTASQEAAAVVTDTVTVDVHNVGGLVALTAEAQREAGGDGDSHVDGGATVDDGYMEAIVVVHPQSVDAEIVDQEDATEEGKATEGTRQDGGGVEGTALEAVDQPERLLTEVRLVEETVTGEHREETVEAIFEEAVGGQVQRTLVEHNELDAVMLQVKGTDTMNVEVFQQEESHSSDASENDSFVFEAPVGIQSLVEPHHDSAVEENETSQDNSKTNTVKNGPGEEHVEDQSQSQQCEVEETPLEKERLVLNRTDLDGSLCVGKAEEEDKVAKSVHLQRDGLDHLEEECNETNDDFMPNGHKSDSSVTSAIEDSTEEALDCALIFKPSEETGITARSDGIESVVSDSTEDCTNEEEPLQGCVLKCQPCHDQIGQPYADLAALEEVEGDLNGIAIKEQEVDLISNMEAMP